MSDWSSSPFPRVVERSALRPSPRVLSDNAGESRQVVELSNPPGWLFKEYFNPVDPDEASRLDFLIGLPESLGERELARVNSSTCWPAARVVDHGSTVGVLVSKAPDRFMASFRSVKGDHRKFLEFDWLAKTDPQMMARGLKHQSHADRLSVCANIVGVAALLEAHGLVYLDWSYNNAFWCQLDQSVYVIDMDGCSWGPRLQVENINWDDPLVPRLQLAGNEVDRYRVALLIARCLTGERDNTLALAALQRGTVFTPLGELISNSLRADSVERRPSLAEFREAMIAARRAGSTASHVRPVTAPTGYPGPGGLREGTTRPVSGRSGVTAPGGIKGWKQVGQTRTPAPLASGPEPQTWHTPPAPANWVPDVRPPIGFPSMTPKVESADSLSTEPRNAETLPTGAKAAIAVFVILVAFFLVIVLLRS